MNKNQDTEKQYKPQEIESNWQDKWESDKTFTPNLRAANKAYFTLMMFPYPSAEGLHVGNMYAFTGSDVHAKFKRMNGYDVFEPIGLDGFGIHSENYALKVGRHPKEQAEVSQKNFYRQLRATGNGYDWTRTLETYDPDYYRWTQWIFIQMFKQGLAYRKKATVNWCPSDKTVLADEQVIDGKCERDGALVEKRELEQWFFRITEYSDRLLSGLDKIDWPEKIKIAQRQWIGKSEGARIRFDIDKSDKSIEVFTTRPDTLFGATFMVVAPEHPIVGDIEDSAVRSYVSSAKKKKDIDRTAEGKEKTGVFSGMFAINPVNQEKIPVWIADYVLMGYGTGAIMAVPAHDQRDFDFAKKFDLPIRQVISAKTDLSKVSKDLKEAMTGSGSLINSEAWNGLSMPADMPKILDSVEEKKFGKREANYHLRDWLISRQRYWGPPIPMIYCSSCFEKGKGEIESMPGWYPVADENLPVLLPDVEDWRPEGSGTSPLANHPEFYEVNCPDCGSKARRETDVSDTFLDSAWYYLRYLSIGNDPKRDNMKPYDMDILKKWTPVAIYIGGAEHSVLHLLYVRFIAMVLHDLKSNPELKLEFEEPFPKFFAHGLIVKDGAKMSKSRGNVVIPDAYISKFGADTLRMYLMFLGPFVHGGDFRDTGIEGMFRFVRRVWTRFNSEEFGKDEPETLQMINRTVKEVTEDIESFSYNTAIAKLMVFYNYISENKSWSKETATSYLKLFAPFAPHFTEELFEKLKLGKGSVHFSSWPTFDEKYLVSDEVIIPIQVNGKRRGEIKVESSKIKDEEWVCEKAKEVIKAYIAGKEVRKVIYVPGKILNFVV